MASQLLERIVSLQHNPIKMITDLQITEMLISPLYTKIIPHHFLMAGSLPLTILSPDPRS